MKNQSAYKNRVFGLDLMRAIAITAVLGSHLLYIFPDFQAWPVHFIKLGGIMGVELFFVLSGFLIGRMLYKIFTTPSFKSSRLGHFLIRRWFRTLPNYYLILVFNILLITAIGRELPENWMSYFFFLQNFSSTMDVFFTESWSLPIEEFAYLLGPSLLLLFYSITKAKKQELVGIEKRSRFFLIVTLCVIFIFLVTKIIYNSNTTNFSLDYWNEELKAVTIYRIDSIFYGVLAAYLSLVYQDHWKKRASFFGLLGIFLFLGFQLALSALKLSIETTPWLFNILYLPFHSICFCLLLPFLSQYKNAPTFISVPITHLSIISYAIYLLHYGIIIQAMRWVWPIEDMVLEERLGYAVIYLFIVVILSTLWYRLYEKPMTDMRDTPWVTKWFS